MADVSRNPEDRAAMRSLESKLAGLESELAAQRRAGEALLSDNKKAAGEAKRDRVQASREKRVRGRTAADAPPETPGAQAESTKATESRTRAETRLGNKLRERVRLEKELRRQASLPVPTGVQGAGFQTRQPFAAGQGIAYDSRLLQNRLKSIAAERARESVADRARREYAYRDRYIGPERQLGAGGGGQLPPGPPPTAAGGAAGGGGDDRDRKARAWAKSYNEASRATQNLTDKERALFEQSKRASGSTAGFDAEMQKATRNMGLSSQAFSRNGYLTSEFITAAARGEVTIRELGTQVGGTIAKFAGWTAAATAVYGAVGAIYQLGKGALDASSGVGLLNRVVTTKLPGGGDELQQKFRDLSQQFNLPIEDVVQATYGAAKVFAGDLPSALKGAESALFAVKVGELDAATATRYLNSIVQGFGLTAKDLPGVFDAINQAQNRFGGNTGQIVEGLAKVSGAFRLAGGSTREAIALITTATRLTGRPAGEIGTALTRAASSQLTPQGAKRLKEAGLDPSLEFMDLLEQASKESQGASAERVNELARALIPAGGQFARIFAPILQNRKLYDRIFKELDPSKTKGSASRELEKALKQPNEQLKQLLVNAQRLGSALAQAGAFQLLGGVLKALNLSVNGMVRLVELFDKATFGATKLLVPLAEIAVVMRLLRRFDVGGSLPVGGGAGYGKFRDSLRPTSDARLSKQVLIGARDEEKFLRDRREQAARQRSEAVFQANRAYDRRSDLQRAGAPEEEVARAQGEVNDKIDAAVRAADDEGALVDRQKRLINQRTHFERLRAQGLDAQVAAQRAGFQYAPGTYERPAAEQAKRVSDLAKEEGRTGPTSATIGALGDAADEADTISSNATKMRVAKDRAARATATAATRLRASGVTGRALARTAETAAGGAAAFGAGATAAARSVGTYGRNLGSSLGPLDRLLLAFTAGLLVQDQIRQAADGLKNDIATLNSDAGGAQGIADRAAAELKNTDFRSKIFAAYQKVAKIALAPLTGGASLFIPKIDTPDDVANDLARARQREAKSLEKANALGKFRGVGEISRDFKGRIARAQTDAEREQLYQEQIRQINQSRALSGVYNAGPQAKQAARAQRDTVLGMLRDLQAATGDLDKALASIGDQEGISKFSSATAARYSLQGPRKSLFARSGRGIAKVRELLAKGQITPEEAVADIEKFQQDAQQAAEQSLQRRLPYARSPQQAGQLRQQFIQRMRQTLITGTRRDMNIIQKRITGRQKQIRDLEKEVSKDVQRPVGEADKGDALGGPLGQLGRLPSARKAPVGREEEKKRIQLRKLRTLQSDDKKQLTQLRQQMGLSKEEFAALVAEQRRAQFEAEQAVFDAQTELGAARIADPRAQIQYRLGRINSRLGDVAKEYGKQSVQYLNALTTAAQLQQQLVQESINTFQSQLEYRRAVSNIGATEEQRLRGALGDAQQFANFIQGQKGISNVQRLQALTAVANAQSALADFIRQQAQDLIAAQAAYALSRTEDPIRQARIKLQQQQRLLKFARTPAERLNALAEINNARRDLRQTRQREAFDEIEFEAEVGKITREAELRRLKMLLKTIKGNRDLRREIQRRIYALEHEDTNIADLDVGSIKLPTLYEIRRAVAGGLNSQRSVRVTNAPTLHLNVAPGGEYRVAEVLDETLGTSTRAAMRAAGMSQ